MRRSNTWSTGSQVSVKIPDVRLHLTQRQYGLLIALSQSIPKVFAGVADIEPESPPPQSEPASVHGDDLDPNSAVDLRPELSSNPASDARPWTSMEVVVAVGAVKLHLYDVFANTQADLKEHGIARFALNDNSLRLKVLSDGALESQVVLKSMTMNNTRPGNSRFREIMPAAQHDRNQIMLLFTMSGGPNSNGLAVLTVDSPEVIFAVDPIIALLEFFTSAFTSDAEQTDEDAQAVADQEQQPESTSSGSFDFRLDLHDVSISVLEDDSNVESQAIRLAIKQLLVSQQVRHSHIVYCRRTQVYAGRVRRERQASRDVPHPHGQTRRKRPVPRRRRPHIHSGQSFCGCSPIYQHRSDCLTHRVPRILSRHHAHHNYRQQGH